MRQVVGSIPGPCNQILYGQRLVTTATFLQSCAAQALSRGDGPHHSLHASPHYHGYNEDLISFNLVYVLQVFAIAHSINTLTLKNFLNVIQE